MAGSALAWRRMLGDCGRFALCVYKFRVKINALLIGPEKRFSSPAAAKKPRSAFDNAIEEISLGIDLEKISGWPDSRRISPENGIVEIWRNGVFAIETSAISRRIVCNGVVNVNRVGIHGSHTPAEIHRRIAGQQVVIDAV